MNQKEPYYRICPSCAYAFTVTEYKYVKLTFCPGCQDFEIAKFKILDRIQAIALQEKILNIYRNKKK